MNQINKFMEIYAYIVMLMYADFFCSFTMPPGHLLVSTLGHPPPGTIASLG